MSKFSESKWKILLIAGLVAVIAAVSVISCSKKQEEPVQTTTQMETTPEQTKETEETVTLPESATEKQTVRQTTAAVRKTAEAETETVTVTVTPPHSLCEACGGTGWVLCPTCQGEGLLTKTCVFCEGTGVTYSCHTCDGTGTVYDPGTDCPYCEDGVIYIQPHGKEEGYYETCPHCNGTGIERTEGDYVCEDCGGTGTLSEPVICEECGGSGVTVLDDCPDCYVDENGVHTGMIPCSVCGGSKLHPEPPTLTADEASEIRKEFAEWVASGEGLIAENNEAAGEEGTSEGETTSEGESTEETGGQEESSPTLEPEGQTSAEAGTESTSAAPESSETAASDAHIETDVEPGNN